MKKIKTILVFVLITILLVNCKENKNISDIYEKDIQQKNDELSALIDSLYIVDQKVQNEVVDAFQKGITGDSIKTLFANIPLVYKRHIPILKTIIKKNGYPTIKSVGKESSHNFFIMVQHSDSDVEFQSEMLVLIKAEVEKGNVSGKDFAFLTDRVLLAKGKQQRYGTQVEYEYNKRVFPKNLYKPEECNKRRAKLKMESLEDYLKFMLEEHKKQNN